MPHAPCLRCGQLVLAAQVCDLCAAIVASDARRQGKRAIGAALASACATAALVVAGHPAAAASLGVGLAVTAALWVSSLPLSLRRVAGAASRR